MSFAQVRIFLLWGFVFFILNTILTAVFDTVTSGKISILVTIFSALITSYFLVKNVYPKEAIKGYSYTPLITGVVLAGVALIFEYVINFIAFYDSNLLRFGAVIISSGVGGKLAFTNHKNSSQKTPTNKKKKSRKGK
jgi:hypothetical protein